MRILKNILPIPRMTLINRLYNNILNDKAKHAVKRVQFELYPYPMMSREEVGIIKEMLLAGSYKRIIEFGAGGSTLYFPKFINEKATWLSFEFDERWFNGLKSKVPKKVDIRLLRDMRDVDRYSGYIHAADFILIDSGVSRGSLIERLSVISNNATVLLHDAGRSSYRHAKNLFQCEIPLTRPHSTDMHGNPLAGGLSLLISKGNKGNL
jgi:hypothetical protein